MAVSLGNILSTNLDDSDEDDNDEDYVPSGAEESEEEPKEAEDEDEEVDSTEITLSKHKGKLKSGKAKSRKRKKRPLEGEDSGDNFEAENSVIPALQDEPKDQEKEKKRKDALWEDFLSDMSPPAKKINKTSSTVVDPIPTKQSSLKESPKPQKVTITEVFEFAGEAVIVKKEVDSNSATKQSSVQETKESPQVPSPSFSAPLRVKKPGGIGSVLGQVLGKKSKLSTLEKSKLDWSNFKKEEGVEEVLEQYKKSKNGYLERQAFLERTDLKQFEIEKSLRATNRSHRV